MIHTYKEKLIEDFIRDFPQEFLGENLVLFQQQPIIEGFRPDLIFKDERNQYVIVEVQLYALDRNHFYRTLEYRDLLKHQESCDEPRIILVCNEIPSRYERLTKSHNVRCLTITKDEFIAKAKQLNPTIRIRKQAQTGTGLTINDILKKLSTKNIDNKMPVGLDALVFWLYSDRHSNENPYIYKYTNVPKLPKQFELYFDDYRGPYDNSPKSIHSEIFRSKPPKEIIVNKAAFDNINFDKLCCLHSWLELSCRHHVMDLETLEIVLGYRSFNDIYGYESYIQNSIRKFEPIWRNYGKEIGYNLDKMREDLNSLFNFQFYTGKFPNFESIQFCSRIKITEGPGSLVKNTERVKEIVRYRITHGVQGYTEKDYTNLEEFIGSDKKEWVTVEFIEVKSSVLRTLAELIDMLWIAVRFSNIENLRSNTKNIDSLIPNIGIMPAKHIKDIPTDALKLSSKYFQHMKKPTKEPKNTI